MSEVMFTPDCSSRDSSTVGVKGYVPKAVIVLGQNDLRP